MLKKVLIGVGALLVLSLAAIGIGYVSLQRPDIPYAELDKAYGYPEAETRFVDLGGGLVAHVRVTGNRAGQTLLLIHGYTASTHTWDALTERLKGDYRLIQVDLPGHGLTRTPLGYEPNVEKFADFVEAVCERLGQPKLVAIGSSMGGNTAWQLALRTPGRVNGLVLIDSAGWPDPSGGAATETPVTQLMRNPTLGPILRDLDATAIFTQGLRASFANPALATPEMVKRYTDLSRAPGHRPVILELRLNYQQRTPASNELLAKLNQPTLVLHGEKDALIPVEIGRKFDEAIPNSKLITYPNVGHLPHEEIPDQVAQDIRDFLKTIYPEPPSGAPLVAPPVRR